VIYHLSLSSSSQVLFKPIIYICSILLSFLNQRNMSSGVTIPFPIEISNKTVHPVLYCYIVGLNASNGQLMFISSNGQTPYYPPNPSNNVTPLAQDCSIEIGGPGDCITAYIPYMESARIYFSVANKLQFFTNPSGNGPACVQPSPTNETDPNYSTLWEFYEFTLNEYVMYFNTSFVDFVAMPVAATLTLADGTNEHISGMPLNGVANIRNQLIYQSLIDQQPWGQLIQEDSEGNFLRVLSPQQATIINPSLFAGYFEPYINQVWSQYVSKSLTVDSQAQWGVVRGTVGGGTLNINGCSFNKPTTQEILSCSTGPFATGSNAQVNCLIPRLAAGFNRSTLLTNMETPAPIGPSCFYQNMVTNHYSRIVHEQHLDGRGYAFPYDDVCANGGPDQSGSLYSGTAAALTIAVGGNGAFVDPSVPIINA
jgi:hypothetical protein